MVETGSIESSTDNVLARLESSMESIPLDVQAPGSTKPVRHALKPAFPARPPSTFNYAKFIERAKREGQVLRGPRKVATRCSSEASLTDASMSDVKLKGTKDRFLISGMSSGGGGFRFDLYN